MKNSSASVIGRKFEGMRTFVKLIQQMGAKHSTWKVFEDFLAMSAISISNAVIPNKDREQQYLDIAKSYTAEEMDNFAQMLADLVNSLEREVQYGRLTDVLGAVFHELELHNKYNGQFFTPQHICDCMGLLSFGQDKQHCCPEIERRGYLEVGEPACGSGAMMLGFANAMKDSGYNYCTDMVATCTDIDVKCVHMAYLQLSLYGIPAVVVHGNTITVQEWSHWYTPVYVLNRWDWRRKVGFGKSALTAPSPKQKSDMFYFYFNFDESKGA